MDSTRPIVLSDSQKQVISHRGGDLHVIACAGSGKTETISRRVAGLILTTTSNPLRSSLLHSPSAQQPNSRNASCTVLLSDRARVSRSLRPMYVGTIHGYCFRMLQRYVPKYGKYDVLDDHRHAGILSSEFFELGLSKFRRPGEARPSDGSGRWMS